MGIDTPTLTPLTFWNIVIPSRINEEQSPARERGFLTLLLKCIFAWPVSTFCASVMHTMKRRIHFFTGELVYHETSREGITTSTQADLQSVLNVIDQLPWDKNLPENAYEVDNDGHVAVKIVRFGANRAFGQLAKSRSSALPLVDKLGKIEPLKLGPDEALFEASHFGLFWDRHHCILVLEYNQHAPRHKRLGDYLTNKLFNHKSAFLDSARFRPMVKKGPVERMLEHEELGLLEMTFFRDVLDELGEHERYNDLYNAMKINADAAPGLEVVRFGVRASAASKRARVGFKPSWLKHLARMVRDHADRFLSAKVEMYPKMGNDLVDINLLSDKWVQSLIVPTLDGRTIDSTAMLSQIEQLYDDTIDELISGSEQEAIS